MSESTTADFGGPELLAQALNCADKASGRHPPMVSAVAEAKITAALATAYATIAQVTATRELAAAVDRQTEAISQMLSSIGTTLDGDVRPRA
jgi:hypothetical protein